MIKCLLQYLSRFWLCVFCMQAFLWALKHSAIIWRDKGPACLPPAPAPASPLPAPASISSANRFNTGIRLANTSSGMLSLGKNYDYIHGYNSPTSTRVKLNYLSRQLSHTHGRRCIGAQDLSQHSVSPP